MQRFSLILLLLILLAATACGPHPACISACELRNEECILNALSPEGLRECDRRANRCIGHCR